MWKTMKMQDSRFLAQLCLQGCLGTDSKTKGNVLYTMVSERLPEDPCKQCYGPVKLKTKLVSPYLARSKINVSRFEPYYETKNFLKSSKKLAFIAYRRGANILLLDVRGWVGHKKKSCHTFHTRKVRD